MEVDFVPYQEALELHNIGVIFPNVGFPHFAIYRNGNLSFANQDAIQMFVEYFKDEVVVAPLYQQVFRWFRENHDLQSYIRHKCPDVESYYDFVINEDVYDVMKETHEEAELACLRKLIGIVKSQKE